MDISKYITFSAFLNSFLIDWICHISHTAHTEYIACKIEPFTRPSTSR